MEEVNSRKPFYQQDIFDKLDCPNELLETIQVTINKFVTRATHSWISEKRIYNKPKNGGLGAINLKVYASSLRMAWVKRERVDSGWTL